MRAAFALRDKQERSNAIDAASAAETIRPLVGAQGQVLANPGANSVVVADFSDNLARIRSLIGRIDVDRSSYEVVALENASAREIAGVLQQVMAAPGGGQGMVTVTPVESSNSIVLRGDGQALARVRGLIHDLDGRSRATQDVNVVFLEHANAEQQHNKKWSQRRGVGREHGPAAEHDRIVVTPLVAPDRDALIL
jgi:general secretion pathway protein D